MPRMVNFFAKTTSKPKNILSWCMLSPDRLALSFENRIDCFDYNSNSWQGLLKFTCPTPALMCLLSENRLLIVLNHTLWVYDLRGKKLLADWQHGRPIQWIARLNDQEFIIGDEAFRLYHFHFLNNKLFNNYPLARPDYNSIGVMVGVPLNEHEIICSYKDNLFARWNLNENKIVAFYRPSYRERFVESSTPKYYTMPQLALIGKDRLIGSFSHGILRIWPVHKENGAQIINDEIVLLPENLKKLSYHFLVLGETHLVVGFCRGEKSEDIDSTLAVYDLKNKSWSYPVAFKEDILFLAAQTNDCILVGHRSEASIAFRIMPLEELGLSETPSDQNILSSP